MRLLIALVLAASAMPAARVYIVTRATTVEARALFSGRLVGLNATSLQWLETSGVVRAELPADSLDRVKADKDVVLVFNSEDRPAADPQPLPPPVTASMPQPPQPPPSLAMGMAEMSPMGMGGFGMGGLGMGGLGMGGMGMGTAGMTLTNLVDVLAGMLARRMFTRTPSCHISVKSPPASFSTTGGEGVISVKASGACAWQAQSNVDWIRIQSGAGVSGPGVVNYTVKPGRQRTGAILITAASGGAALRGTASLVVVQAK